MAKLGGSSPGWLAFQLGKKSVACQKSLRKGRFSMLCRASTGFIRSLAHKYQQPKALVNIAYLKTELR